MDSVLNDLPHCSVNNFVNGTLGVVIVQASPIGPTNTSINKRSPLIEYALFVSCQSGCISQYEMIVRTTCHNSVTPHLELPNSYTEAPEIGAASIEVLILESVAPTFRKGLILLLLPQLLLEHLEP